VLVLIPGGKFWMGAQNAPGLQNHDPQARGDEGPVHEVELSPYFLSKFEMTQGQWRRIAGVNPSFHQGPDSQAPSELHPVENVSWEQCYELLARLGLSLPSEAQWEFGARGNTSTPWWTGADRVSLVGKVNIADRAYVNQGGQETNTSDLPELDDGSAVHCMVGLFPANPFGLHEVAGNLWEWCLDGYDPFFYRLDTGLNPVSPWLDSVALVMRGGGWNNAASRSRSAARLFPAPGYRDSNTGLRPARNLDGPQAALGPDK
jgi:formylglycine-generating enzyme required for sulfatase activity